MALLVKRLLGAGHIAYKISVPYTKPAKGVLLASFYIEMK